MGRLADMFGRRRVFFIGAGVFATFSVIGGFAPNIWLLLTSRFIMGIGGAMMWPAILGMRFSLCPKSRAGLAGGLGSAGFGNAFGPLLGGVLTDTIGWRLVFRWHPYRIPDRRRVGRLRRRGGASVCRRYAQQEKLEAAWPHPIARA
jgi:MFS family permease